MTDFADRVVLVTGGANGMGEATAHTFAKADATVVIADFDIERAPLVESQIRADGGDAHAIITDIREPAQVAALVDEIARRWGRVDVVHNNAALVKTRNVEKYGTPEAADIYIRNMSTPHAADPQDVANVVLFLSSDEAKMITGHVIPVDGGLSDTSPIAADYRDWLGSGSQ